MLSITDMTETDRDAIRHWRNQPDVAEWMYTNHEISETEHAAWFARHLHRDDEHYWVIRWDGRGVGVVNLTEIDRVNRTCSWGIYLADSTIRGTGAGAGATFLSIDFAFSQLGLMHVSASALALNIRAIDLYTNIGFRNLGQRADLVVRGDEHLNVVDFVLEASDWAAMRSNHFDRLVADSILAHTT